jgi:hypothetical protein
MRRTVERVVEEALGLLRAGAAVLVRVRLVSTFGLGAGGVTAVSVVDGVASGAGSGASGSLVAGSTVVSASGTGGLLSWASKGVEDRARTAAIAVMALRRCGIVGVMIDQPAGPALRRAVSDQSSR